VAIRITKPDSADVHVQLTAPTEDELKYAAETNPIWREWLGTVANVKQPQPEAQPAVKPTIGFGAIRDEVRGSCLRCAYGDRAPGSVYCSRCLEKNAAEE